MSDRPLTTDGVPAIAESAPRVRLAVLRGRGVGTTIDCRRVVTLLGSRKGCKLNLRHPKVSAVHAAIVNTGSDVFAVDLVTRNGTLLNGLRMEHERLSDDDVLSIGPWQFRIKLGHAPASGQKDLHPFDLEPSPSVVALELVATGRILRPERDVCIIGRRSGCDITISDKRVSRAHALLLSYFGRPAIMDLLSQNQTVVNDVPVRFRILANDDVVTVGETRFRARLANPQMGDKRSNGRKPGNITSAPAPQKECTDQIDIHEVEGAQRWRIAESVERSARAK